MYDKHPIITTLFIFIAIWLYMSNKSYDQLRDEHINYVYFVHQTIEKYPEIKKEILEYEKNIQEYKVDKAINHIGRFD